MLSLDQPWALLLLPLPLIVRWLMPALTTQQPALAVPFFARLEAAGATASRRRRSPGWRWLLASLIWLSLVGAATDPQWLGPPVDMTSSGRDLLLAVDLSGSMRMEDMKAGGELVPRLVAVKVVLDDFIKQRQGDRLGLILFGTRAYLQSPLTFDHTTVREFLNDAQIGFAGPETAIGDAIGLAVKRLRDRPGDRHVLILLTDGANTAGAVSPLSAARVAADQNIVIYTVGVGADDLVVPGPLGGSFLSRRINPSRDLDEQALRQIAELTGGRYFRARNPAELAEIYALLDELEPVESAPRQVRPRQSWAWLGLAFALGLSTLWSTGAVLARHWQVRA
ncbi:MAG: VWA domain-containing protein [Spongiibacteraceae bacterium]|jgi:Ca-activated chloride channel family protein|nr:VWA domain-containing protein [Spongiibacteraceae bacterium]